MAKKLLITQVRSSIGKLPKQRATLRALGLRRISAERVHDDTAVIRGMIDKVKHLVSVKEMDQ
ncbi:MAG: 50S ribosomal protein L30 [Spirochaetes bacterium]|nr:50S ribosomal protein L30 [Spirochaetota bacterium]